MRKTPPFKISMIIDSGHRGTPITEFILHLRMEIFRFQYLLAVQDKFLLTKEKHLKTELCF